MNEKLLFQGAIDRDEGPLRVYRRWQCAASDGPRGKGVVDEAGSMTMSR